MASQFSFGNNCINKENIQSEQSEQPFELIKNNKENIPPNEKTIPTRVFGQEIINIRKSNLPVQNNVCLYSSNLKIETIWA